MNPLKRLAALVGLRESDALIQAAATEATLRSGAMDRRAFLKIVGAGATAAVVAPSLDFDALLWTPQPIVTVGEIAAEEALVGNAFLTTEWLSLEALRLLTNKLEITRFSSGYRA